MVAENIFIIAEQLSFEEQLRLYKMLREQVQKNTLRNKKRQSQLITKDEAIAYIKEKCFSRKTSLY